MSSTPKPKPASAKRRDPGACALDDSETGDDASARGSGPSQKRRKKTVADQRLISFTKHTTTFSKKSADVKKHMQDAMAE
eukprot:6306511-Lingulodinium_polyedra.AAC.1